MFGKDTERSFGDPVLDAVLRLMADFGGEPSRRDCRRRDAAVRVANAGRWDRRLRT
jgi:hypothetical protein